MSGWHKFNDSDTVLVFVHGLFSDSGKCWTSKCGKFWPDLIFQDKRFLSPSIYLADYYTSHTSNDYGVQNCALELKQGLQRRDSEYHSPPLDKENIVFVTHSTGGVVVRYTLEAYPEIFKGKKIALCLYASPSLGATLGFFAKPIFWTLSKFSNNLLAQELSKASPILQELDVRFSRLLTSNKLDIAGTEAYENKAPFKIPYVKARVVKSESAARYFGHGQLIADSDHSSIVKPTSQKAYSHIHLLDFLTSSKFITQKGLKHQLDYPSLFETYDSDLEEYYVARKEDKNLCDLMASYSLWVSGAPGIGKTVSISRAISRNKLRYRYISLGPCIQCSVPEMIKEICQEIVEESVVVGAETKDHINLIAETISNTISRDFDCLLIEEIPIQDPGEFVEFSNYIFSLLNRIDHHSGFRLVLSSVFKPNQVLPPELEKTKERLKMVEMGAWSNEDVERLKVILTKDTNVSLPHHETISGFEGNPRKLKIHYRDKLVKIGSYQI